MRFSDVATRSFVLSAAVFYLASCGDGGSSGPSGAGSITLLPTTATLDIGESVQLMPTVKDANGNTISAAGVTWATSNAGVALVSNAGVVRGVQAGGPVTITGTAGTVSATASVNVYEGIPPSTEACANTATAIPITFGQTYSGHLSKGDCLRPEEFLGARFDLYTFTLASGATIRIDMQSSIIDTWLQLDNAVRTPLAADDDAGVGTNSLITRVMTAGTYYIIAANWQFEDFGPYDLIVTIVSAN